MRESMGITDVLLQVREQTDTEQVPVDTLITALESRGFGPAPGPGPACAAAHRSHTGCAQHLRHPDFPDRHPGQRRPPLPWVPGRLRDLSIHREKLIGAIDRVRPVTTRIDRLFSPRLLLLSRPVTEPDHLPGVCGFGAGHDPPGTDPVCGRRTRVRDHPSPPSASAPGRNPDHRRLARRLRRPFTS